MDANRPPSHPRPRLADRHARRREVPGSALPPLAGRPPAHPAAPARLRLAGHRAPAARRPASLKHLPGVAPLLPLPAAADAGRRGELASAALRPRRQLQPLRRQGGPRRRAACRTSATASPRCATPGTCASAYFAGRRRRAQGPAARPLPRPAARLGPPHRRAASRTSSPSARPCGSASPSATAATARSSTRRSIPTSTTPPRCRARTIYLAVSAFAPYKRLDLAVAACNRLGRPLVVIGSGQDEARLRALAGPDVRFLGWQPDEVDPRPPAPLPGAALPRRGGLRHRPRRGDGLRRPGDRLRPRRRHRDGRAARRTAAHRPALLFEEQTAECLAEALLRVRGTARRLRPRPRPPAGAALQRPPLPQELFAYLDAVLCRAPAPRRAA